MSEEGMCDKRLSQALRPKPFASHEGAKKIPWQLTAVLDTLPKRNMVCDHNDT